MNLVHAAVGENTKNAVEQIFNNARTILSD